METCKLSQLFLLNSPKFIPKEKIDQPNLECQVLYYSISTCILIEM